MGFGWQEISVFLLLIGAVGYLIRHYIRRRRDNRVCDRCPVRKSQSGPLSG